MYPGDLHFTKLCYQDTLIDKSHKVLFGEVRWRTTDVTTKDVEILIEKGLRWLQGATAQWEVHYAFFAKAFGDVAVDVLPVEALYFFTPEAVTELSEAV